jgi:hypothetical protein
MPPFELLAVPDDPAEPREPPEEVPPFELLPFFEPPAFFAPPPPEPDVSGVPPVSLSPEPPAFECAFEPSSLEHPDDEPTSTIPSAQARSRIEPSYAAVNWRSLAMSKAAGRDFS